MTKNLINYFKEYKKTLLHNILLCAEWLPTFIIFYCLILNVNQVMAEYKPAAWLIWLYDFLDRYTFAKWSLAYFIIIEFIFLWSKIWNDTSYSLRSILVSFLFLVLLINFTAWNYVQIYRFIDFRWLGIILSSLYLLYLCTKGVYLFYKKLTIAPVNNRYSFTTTMSKDAEIETEWDFYINSFVQKIKDADVSSESFAAGIVGEWGTGKTYFMEKVKVRFNHDKNFICLDFNPWKSNDEVSLIIKFFNTLQDCLSAYYSPLNYQLKKYSQKLVDANISSNINWVFRLFLFLNDTHHLEDKINESLLSIRKKIIVFIDDIDRLDKNEILCMMKLIRNTASFKNVIYIGAYDKSYIERTLKQEIGGVSEYIKKIFPLEISLPVLPDDFIPNMLESRFKQLLPDENEFVMNQIEQAIDISYNGLYLVSSFLPKQRDVVNFSMQFITDASQFLETEEKAKNINWTDLFWLEIIHYTDTNLYKLLQYSDDNLLERVQISNLGIYTYKVINESDVFKKLSAAQKYVLTNILYKKVEGASIAMSIVVVKNHYKYFSYHISPKDMLGSEFSSLIKGKIKIIDWFNKRKSQNKIQVDKLVLFCYLLEIQKYNLDYIRNYISLLLHWTYFAWHKAVPSLFSKKLYFENINGKDILKNDVMKGFASIIEKSNIGVLDHIQQILSSLYEAANYYDMNPDTRETLLSVDDIKNLENKLWDKLNILLPIEKPSQIITKRRLKNILLHSIVVVREYYDLNIHYYAKTNLLMNKIIDKFASESMDISDLNEFALTMMPNIDDELARTEPDYLDDIKNRFDNKIDNLFGDKETFKLFLSQCYGISDDVIEKTFRSLV